MTRQLSSLPSPTREAALRGLEFSLLDLELEEAHYGRTVLINRLRITEVLQPPAAGKYVASLDYTLYQGETEYPDPRYIRGTPCSTREEALQSLKEKLPFYPKPTGTVINEDSLTGLFEAQAYLHLDND